MDIKFRANRSIFLYNNLAFTGGFSPSARRTSPVRHIPVQCPLLERSDVTAFWNLRGVIEYQAWMSPVDLYGVSKR